MKLKSKRGKMHKIFLFTLFMACAAVLISCSSSSAKNRNEENAVPVTSVKVRSGHAAYYVSYPANIVALKEVELRGQVSGYITGIYFTEGKQVRAGEMLYEIDRRKYQAAYEVAQANLKIAQGNQNKVQLDADRYTDLAKQEAVAKQLLDHVLTDLNNAKQQVDAANSELIKAKTDFDYSLIRAPFDGTIGFSYVKLGALVTPGQTLLNTISTDDPLGVDFEINEKELRHFEELAAVRTEKADSTFRIILPDNSLYPYNGSISVIDRAVDPQTGSIRIRVTIPNTGKMLKPGMSCKMMVLNGSGNQVLIPYKAVMEQLGEYFVFSVRDNKAEQVRVTLGARVASDVIVMKGLNEGDEIVVDGIQKIHNGSAVRSVQQ